MHCKAYKLLTKAIVSGFREGNILSLFLVLVSFFLSWVARGKGEGGGGGVQ